MVFRFLEKHNIQGVIFAVLIKDEIYSHRCSYLVIQDKFSGSSSNVFN